MLFFFNETAPTERDPYGHPLSLHDALPISLAFPVVDPAWRTSTEVMAKVSGVAGISLALRHSGYGWLCFLLPDSEARALGHWLLDHAEVERAEAQAA